MPPKFTGSSRPPPRTCRNCGVALPSGTDISAHLAVCPKRPVPTAVAGPPATITCRNCGAQLAEGTNVHEHNLTCPSRPRTCRNCGVALPAGTNVSTHLAVCPKRPVPTAVAGPPATVTCRNCGAQLAEGTNVHEHNQTCRPKNVKKETQDSRKFMLPRYRGVLAPPSAWRKLEELGDDAEKFRQLQQRLRACTLIVPSVKLPTTFPQLSALPPDWKEQPAHGAAIVRAVRDAHTAFDKHLTLVAARAELISTALAARSTCVPGAAAAQTDLAAAETFLYSELVSQLKEFCHALAQIDWSTSYGLKRSEREVRRLRDRLPALAVRQQIVDTLANNQFLVVQGHTGSGKSTQMPQYVADMLLEHRDASSKAPMHIFVTQPRKVAATSLAERVLQEWCGPNASKASKNLKPVGCIVGGAADPGWLIEYVTEGAFLHMLQSGRFRADRTAAVIIDEAHERSINCDLIVGQMKSIAQDNAHLRVIVTSATLDVKLFCRYLNNCPNIEIPGRTFPVDMIYAGGEIDPNADYVAAAVKAVHDLCRQASTKEAGDILCFLTGADELDRAEKLLRTHLKDREKQFFILTLFGRQEPAEQRAVFAPSALRKVIFATDVAETSVTIDGVKWVVDTGVAKTMSFDPRRNISELAVTPICRSSADQRKGRAGRTQSGTCIRLYSKEQYETMQVSQTCELLSSPLHLTSLTLAAMEIDVRSFDWVEPPEPEVIENCVRDLVELGGVVTDGKISATEFGRFAAELQADVQLARLIFLTAKEEPTLLAHAVQMASLATVGDRLFRRIRQRPNESFEEFSKRRKALDSRFVEKANGNSDMLTALQIWIDSRILPIDVAEKTETRAQASDNDSCNSDDDTESVSTHGSSIGTSQADRESNTDEVTAASPAAVVYEALDDEQALGDDEDEDPEEPLTTLGEPSLTEEYHEPAAAEVVMPQDCGEESSSDDSFFDAESLDDESSEDEDQSLAVDSMMGMTAEVVTVADPGAEELESASAAIAENADPLKVKKILFRRANQMQQRRYSEDYGMSFPMVQLAEKTARDMLICASKFIGARFPQWPCTPLTAEESEKLLELVIRAFKLQVAVRVNDRSYRVVGSKNTEEVRLASGSAVVRGQQTTGLPDAVAFGNIVKISGGNQNRAFAGMLSVVGPLHRTCLPPALQRDLQAALDTRPGQITIGSFGPDAIRYIFYRSFTEMDVAVSLRWLLIHEVRHPSAQPDSQIFAQFDRSEGTVTLIAPTVLLLPLKVEFMKFLARFYDDMKRLPFETPIVGVHRILLKSDGSIASFLNGQDDFVSLRLTRGVASLCSAQITATVLPSLTPSDCLSVTCERSAFLVRFSSVKAAKAGRERLAAARLAERIETVVTSRDFVAPPSSAQDTEMIVKLSVRLCPAGQADMITPDIVISVGDAVARLFPPMPPVTRSFQAASGYLTVTAKQTANFAGEIRTMVTNLDILNAAHKFYCDVVYLASVPVPQELATMSTVMYALRGAVSRTRSTVSDAASKASDPSRDGLTRIEVVKTGGCTFLEIVAPSTDSVLRTRAKLEGLIHGTPINLSAAVKQCLFTRGGRAFIEGLRRDRKWPLRIDDKSHQLLYHGDTTTSSSTQEISDAVCRFAEQWPSLSDVSLRITKRKDIQAHIRPLQQDRSSYLELWINANTLRIIGREATVQALVAVCKARHMATDEPIESGEEDCGICMCPPVDPVVLSCGHVVCEECLKGYFHDAETLGQPLQFPLRCPLSMGCPSHLTVQEVALVSSAGVAVTGDFVHSRFVEKYQSETPESRVQGGHVACANILCHAVQQMPIDRREALCFGCGVKFCSTCVARFVDYCELHDGDCPQERNGAVDSLFKELTEEVMLARCPRCRRVLGDFSGCFAVTCVPECGCGFCGWCLADCGRDAHAHVMSCPRNIAGGYFADINLYWKCRQQDFLKKVVERIENAPKMSSVALSLLVEKLRGLFDLVADDFQRSIGSLSINGAQASTLCHRSNPLTLAPQPAIDQRELKRRNDIALQLQQDEALALQLQAEEAQWDVLAVATARQLPLKELHDVILPAEAQKMKKVTPQEYLQFLQLNSDAVIQQIRLALNVVPKCRFVRQVAPVASSIAAAQRNFGAQSLRGGITWPQGHINDAVTIHLFNDMLRKEQEMAGEWCVFYHSYSVAALIYEVQAAVAALIFGHDNSTGPLPRLVQHEFNTYPTAEILRQNFDKGVFKGFDHDPRYCAVALCAVSSLLQSDTEMTPSQCFVNGYTANPNLAPVLSNVLAASGITPAQKHEAYQDILRLASAHALDTSAFGGSRTVRPGHLLQIFVRRTVVDDLVYASLPYGHPDPSRDRRLSVCLTQNAVVQGQVRIVCNPDYFTNSEAVKLFSYAADATFHGHASAFRKDLVELLRRYIGGPQNSARVLQIVSTAQASTIGLERLEPSRSSAVATRVFSGRGRASLEPLRGRGVGRGGAVREVRGRGRGMPTYARPSNFLTPHRKEEMDRMFA